MTQTRSIAEARRDLSALINEAEAGTPVHITRRGKPVAVVLSVHEYERLTRSSTSFVSAYQRWCEEFRPDALDLDAADPFDSVRDTSQPRPADL